MARQVREGWAGVVLAAGKGVRMKSRIPKVLHRLCGQELIRYPVDLLEHMGIRSIVVVVSPENAESIGQVLGDAVEYAMQPEMKGTGDALSWAMPKIGGQAEHLLVMNGDTPLLLRKTVEGLAESHETEAAALSLLTAQVSAGEDLGRIKRDAHGAIRDIVEASDWQGDDLDFPEINVGVYCFRRAFLESNLDQVEPSSRGERYITSLVSRAAADGQAIGSRICGETEAMGVNNRVQLAQAERIQQRRILDSLMLSGVTIQDPKSTYIDAGVSLGQDSMVLPNTILRGKTRIGANCQIGPNTVIEDSAIGDNCRITASMLEEATVESGVDIGPFSHLRPGAYLESGVHLGNYVEVKNTRMAAGAVSGHFSYLGDAQIGSGVNIGAGTITCNYDGKDKLQTVIESGAFIGCDTMLVAPVRVGADAATGAGAVVTKDVPAARLAVGVPARIIDRDGNPKHN